MKDYIKWMDEDGFWVRDTWSPEKHQFDGEGKLILFPRHRKILSTALEITEEGRFKYETVMFSDVKKTGKTALSASIACWYAEEARPGSEIYVIANTLEQGEGRVMRDVQFHFEKRQAVHGPRYCKISQYRVELHNGTFIQVLSQSFKAAAGSRHGLTLWDEIWGSTTESDRRMWDEMVPIPTVPLSLRFISSYAGFLNESELLWEWYLKGVGIEEHEKGKGHKIPEIPDLPCYVNKDIFTYWSHESDLPWYTQEFLDKQMDQERPAAFLRLFLNQWVTSHEEFLPIEWWDKATQAYTGPATLWEAHPFRRWPISVAIDAGIMKDSTAMVGVGYDANRGKVGLAFHRIWKPSPGDPVDLEATVESELLKLYNKFTISSIRYDPTHLMTIMGRFKRKGLPVAPYEQTIPNMTAASQLLYDLLKNRKLEAYPEEELRKHVQMAVAETSSRGFRIVKSKRYKTHFVDGAIALAMACHDAVSNGGVDISVPIRIESPYADATAMRSKRQQDLPVELRTDEEYDN